MDPVEPSRVIMGSVVKGPSGECEWVGLATVVYG